MSELSSTEYGIWSKDEFGEWKMSEPDLATLVRDRYSKSKKYGKWIHADFGEWEEDSEDAIFAALKVFFKNCGIDIVNRLMPVSDLLNYDIYVHEILDNVGYYLDADVDDDNEIDNDDYILYTQYGNTTGRIIDYKNTPYKLLFFIIKYLDECAEGMYNLDMYMQKHPDLNSSELSTIFRIFRESHEEFYQDKALKRLHVVGEHRKDLPTALIPEIASHLNGLSINFNNNALNRIKSDYDNRFTGFKKSTQTVDLDINNNANKKTRKQKRREWWKQKRKDWQKQRRNTSKNASKESDKKMGVGGNRKTYKRKSYKRKS